MHIKWTKWLLTSDILSTKLVSHSNDSNDELLEFKDIVETNLFSKSSSSFLYNQNLSMITGRYLNELRSFYIVNEQWIGIYVY